MQGDQGIANIYDQNLGFAIKLKLIIINHKQCDPEQSPEFIFDERGGVIGRANNCDWVMKCNGMATSRRHAAITHENGQYFIKDISSNGVILNQDYLNQNEKTLLQRGDIVEFGDYVIRVDMFAGEPVVVEEPVKQAGVSSKEEMLATDNVRVIEPTMDDIPRRSAELGSPADSFEPPAAVIPNDWDLDMEAQSVTPEDVVEKPFAPAFTKETKLLESFFEGLGVDGDLGDKEIDAETMKLLGQNFKVLFKGVSRMHQLQRKAEKKLLNKDIYHIDSTFEDKSASMKTFANAVLASNTQLRNKQLGELRDDFAIIIKHQSSLNDCIDKVGGIVGRQFEPERIQYAFDMFQNQQIKNNPWYRIPGCMNLKALYRKFFQNYYTVRSHEVNKRIKNTFSQRYLQIHAKRLRSQKKPM